MEDGAQQVFDASLGRFGCGRIESVMRPALHALVVVGEGLPRRCIDQLSILVLFDSAIPD